MKLTQTIRIPADTTLEVEYDSSEMRAVNVARAVNIREILGRYGATAALVHSRSDTEFLIDLLEQYIQKHAKPTQVMVEERPEP